jgi:putative oxidoreductase
MTDFGAEKIRNELLLVSRILLMLLFLIFGWSKLTNYGGTVGYLAQAGAPLPALSAVIAIVMEFFVSIAIMLGIFTRPLAALLAFYTLATALIGHRYWSMTGGAHMENMINFYKNVSIMGGLFLLYLTGAGRYSIDSRLKSH